jgi:hypothetical protein
MAKGPQLVPGASRAPISGAGGAMMPGASGRAGIGGTVGSPGGFNLPPKRDWRAPFGAANPGRGYSTQPPGRGAALPPDNRHPARRHGAPQGGAGDDAMAANPSFGPNATNWRRPGPGLRHAPGNIGQGRQAAGGSGAEALATYGGPVDRYGQPQKPANEWSEGQYPGETPWHPATSQYRNARPQQPPPYIRDVDIDYNWFAYTADTEILTRDRGWVAFYDLKAGEFVATRNLETKELEWQAARPSPLRDYDGEIYRFRSRSIDLAVTPEHLMLVNSLPDKAARLAGVAARGGHRGGEVRLQARILADTYTGNTRIPLTAKWTGTPIDEVVFDGDHHRHQRVVLLGDDYCVFMGLYLSEGLIDRKNGLAWRVKIGQSPNSDRLKAFEKELKRMFGARVSYRAYGSGDGGGFYIHSAALARFCESFGHAHERFIPADIMNAPARQLRLFWDAYALGDGTFLKHASKTGRTGRNRGVLQRISTASRKMADQFQELALKMGYHAGIGVERPRTSIIRPKDRAPYASTRRERYRISLHGATHARFTVTKEKYKGKVYCVSVPNGVVYVRRVRREEQGVQRWDPKKLRRGGLARSAERADWGFSISGPCWSGNTPFQPVWP